MKLDERIRQLDGLPILNKLHGEGTGVRSSIHRTGGGLLWTLIVSRGGSYHGTKI